MRPALHCGLECSSYRNVGSLAIRALCVPRVLAAPHAAAAAAASKSGSRSTGRAMSDAAAAAAAPAPADGAQAASSSSSSQQQPQGAEKDPIVQWVVLRRDLWGELGWPLGPVIAQACHASTAAMLSNLEDEQTRQYVAPEAIDHMHKVVLEVKGEAQLRGLSEKLLAAGVAHRLWVEQPEDFPTCLATKPYRRSEAGAHFKKLQLCKAALGAKP